MFTTQKSATKVSKPEKNETIAITSKMTRSTTPISKSDEINTTLTAATTTTQQPKIMETTRKSITTTTTKAKRSRSKNDTGKITSKGDIVSGRELFMFYIIQFWCAHNIGWWCVMVS